MPESVTDRPTESHEYILMLTKSAKYYWDMEAVRENLDSYTFCRLDTPGTFGGDHQASGHAANREGRVYEGYGRNLRSVWNFPTQPYKEAHFATFPEELPERCIKAATPEYGCCDKCGMPYERIVESIKDSLRPKSRPVGIVGVRVLVILGRLGTATRVSNSSYQDSRLATSL